MNELVQQFSAAGIRYLLIGGQAMRLSGMPRFSMDWDFFIPARDPENFARLNQLLEKEVDAPLVPLGPAGENFIQRTRPAGEWCNFIWACRACRVLMRRSGLESPARWNRTRR